MPTAPYKDEDETRPLTASDSTAEPARHSFDSVTSITSSSSSIALEILNGNGSKVGSGHADKRKFLDKDYEYDEEDIDEQRPYTRLFDKRARRILWSLGGLCFGGWLLALVLFLSRQNYTHKSNTPWDPKETVTHGNGKAVTLDQVLGGKWRPKSHHISWIEGAAGEDGLLLEQEAGGGGDYLVVEDVRGRKSGAKSLDSMTLMKHGAFKVDGKQVYPNKVWPSRDLKKVLVLSEEKKNWRHSYTGLYWLYDVATQSAEALDPAHPEDRVQLATWSPQSDAVVFTRKNNMFLREIGSKEVVSITTTGGTNFFFGVPDWVYEEEVFSNNVATWWSEDGKYVAFLSTDESKVPEYPVQYFVSRPSGTNPEPGLENYPEVRKIKYPKAGAPNPTVTLHFYDIKKKQVFQVIIDDDFPDDDRLITEVVWTGKTGQVLIRETNRESDILKVVLIDVKARKGKVVRTTDVTELDGGWFEVSQDTRYIPADPSNGRPEAGYIDTVIHNNFDHLAYFTPLDSSEPKLLTSGEWEVVHAPSAVDLTKNLVYFVATKESPIQRHVYSVSLLSGGNLTSITDTTSEGYYAVSFSTGAGYALLTYQGPSIPWQRVISTPSNPNHFSHHTEDNAALAQFAAEHDLPLEIYSTITIDGFTLQTVERRPPHFSSEKRYPVLFHLYGGPGSQTVDKRFTVDFQAYVASNLGYIVVTVDGRGTGYIGRKARCIVRGHIGYYEALDQIETAKIWGQKPYVDEDRIAIWGWSYGGFMTLKTLELDAGSTFKYGMAVAPVTDWAFYDSVYTERYMHTPQHNPAGYKNTSISNVTALSKNVRWLMMHGIADDNVHVQNSLTLLDKLDLAGVDNYDFHAFPDSDHSIYFHNANRMVYDRKSLTPFPFKVLPFSTNIISYPLPFVSRK